MDTRSPRKVPTRRISFEPTFEDLPRHFAADGDLVASHLIAALSAVFPDGEDYFVRSVRHYRKHIKDPVLAEQVRGFIGQEATHGREHRVFNRRLAELGYPTRLAEQVTRRSLEFRTRHSPAMANLAATAALEHFTAVLAELVLENEEIRQLMGHDAVRDLFTWHALEESEHKAVAFDVYRAVGGPEWLRILVMKVTRLGFVVGMTLQVLLSLARDPAARRRGVLRASFRRALDTPLLKKDVWDALREYDRRGFHPDDRDTDHLVEQWRAELFGDEGSLRDRLVGAAS